MRRRRAAALTLAAFATLASGCAAASTGTTTASGGSSPGSCSPSTLQTLHQGTLTFGADQPVYEPWYVDNDPTNGKGFEDAVAYAVAKQLGYSDSQVDWNRVTFNAAIQPGPKTFDLDLDEFSITAAREKAVDFSSPYYTVNQAIIALKGTPAASVSSIAGLQSLELGAQIGTTSYTAIVDQIHPSQNPRVYQTNDEAKAALQAGQIDALVTDLPTAFYITSAQLKNSTIVGQLPAPAGAKEQFGILLDQDSPLTSCVSRAVDTLRSNGTLASIQHRWLAQVAGAPELQ